MPEYMHPSGMFRIRTSGILELIMTRMRNTRALWLEIGKAVRKDNRDAFSRGGPGWPPLAESTVAAKTAMGLPQRTGTGRVPLRLVQNGQFGPGNILIRSGALRDAAGRMNVKGNLTMIEKNRAEFGVNDSVIPYAKWVHDGTKPHVIRPVRAKTLAFIGVGGTTVFARIVHHPGLQPRSWVEVTGDKLKKYSQIAIDWLTNFGHGEYHEVGDD